MPAYAQSSYPTKPVRVLVGAPPGSGSDVIMRIVTLKLSERWNRSVVIDNRAGALGAIALDIAAQAAPDGYTLATLSGQNLTGMLLKTVQVDIPKAFTPVVQMVALPYLLVVAPSLPVSSVKELIALAKTRPLIYASSGTGSVVHLGMEMFKAMAGVPMTHIAYKGGAPAAPAGDAPGPSTDAKTAIVVRVAPDICANLRDEPSTDANVLQCPVEGTRIRMAGGPTLSPMETADSKGARR